MSLEVFGDEGLEGLSADDLYARGWESDPNAARWWRKGEEDTVYTIQQAFQIEEERSWED